MICSSALSFDESSNWDPKVIRQHLVIPEDQLMLLSNIPEWTKAEDNGSTFYIEKDTSGENSQSSDPLISVTSKKNQEVIQQNIELFDNNFQHRKSILKTYNFNTKKLYKSVSLFEIDNICQNLSSTNSLERALSLPNINLSFDNSYLKTICIESGSKDSSPERHSSYIKNKVLPNPIESGNSDLSHQENTSVAELKKSEKLFWKKTNMEVVSQLPVTISAPAEKIVSNDVNFEILTKKDSSPCFTTETSSKLDNSPIDQQTSLKNIDKSNYGNDNLDEKAEIVTELKIINSSENSESDTCIVKEIISLNVECATENKNVEIDVDAQKINEVSETPRECLESRVSKEQYMSEIYLISTNEPASKISCDAHDAKPEVGITQKTFHQEVRDDKSITAEMLSAKRKLESKNRSSKKRRSTREKEGCEVRSIKKAGEICYSIEHINSMLDVIKQFL